MLALQVELLGEIAPPTALGPPASTSSEDGDLTDEDLEDSGDEDRADEAHFDDYIEEKKKKECTKIGFEALPVSWPGASSSHFCTRHWRHDTLEYGPYPELIELIDY
ncbi:hypothetical protein MRB53_039130 [Persea americana]|nr:hypothetical protein MRB53_039130 [Persea americana]